MLCRELVANVLRKMEEHRDKGTTQTAASQPSPLAAGSFATAVDGAADHGAHTPEAAPTARDTIKGRRQCGWFLLLLLAPANISQR